jgi:competence protein ComEC
MAGLAYLSVAIGRPTRTLRLIALTVLVAVIVDPLLAWSIGFYMSVGATLGLCVGAAPLTKVIPGPRWLAQLVAATVAAQIGVMPAVLTVFGLPSAAGIIANVLAVPVAGMVMLVGLPMAVPSGLMVGGSLNFLATILMWPVRVGVRWVWWVATVFAELRLTGAINVALWVALLSALLAMRHRSSSLVA